MHTVKRLSAGLLAAILVLFSAHAPAAEATHEHAHGANSALTLDHGKRWATDAALREGMSALRAALAAQLPSIHRNTLDAAGYASLASTLEPALAGIFAHCHLPPAADAQLHNVLLPINAAIGRMKQAATVAERRDAAITVISGLADYGRYFDHPGWKPLAE